MPPQISDDEASMVSDDLPLPTQQSKVVRDEEELKVVSEGEEDDDDVEEDEYVVEKITDHVFDEDDGLLKFKVKWEGFDDEADTTWEPEANLETAAEILSAYLEKIGGREEALSKVMEKKKGKKRARASTSSTPKGPANGAKRGKKNKDHPLESTPPASASQAEFKVPAGSWEDHVTLIDACEGSEGEVVVYLTWRAGQKTKHPLSVVYKRCPQKMLQFYEKHLVFKKTDASEANEEL